MQGSHGLVALIDVATLAAVPALALLNAAYVDGAFKHAAITCTS